MLVTEEPMRFAAGLLLAATMLAAQGTGEIVNRGVQAFKEGQYAEAVAQFQKAVDLDPSSTTAHQYLATALMQQYIPGAESPENLAMWSRAESEFRCVLELDANNKTALSSLASLNFNAKKWEDARSWYKALLNV